mmetsp:Transcript_43879/g.49192  ORF Transcript_43879/g.49192 Transcript_43879/m.49192 type:complete len:104 (+) Transcript_43879:244-555(+)
MILLHDEEDTTCTTTDLGRCCCGWKIEKGHDLQILPSSFDFQHSPHNDETVRNETFQNKNSHIPNLNHNNNNNNNNNELIRRRKQTTIYCCSIHYNLIRINIL